MISLIKGQVIANDGAGATILTSGGVGYEVRMAEKTLRGFKVGEEITVLTYLSVREDALDLYGFGNADERDLFLKLISVSGIGPRTGLHILDLGEPAEIGAAINRGDVDYLTKVSGIGKKIAERVVVELKSKLQVTSYKLQDGAQQGDILGDVIDGLVAMGYNAQQAREAVKKLDVAGKNSEQILREVLRVIK